MEYKYFTLDKNPKQFKRISIGEYSIELRIEWNTRSKAWYVLGYSGDEIVISNVKMTPNQLYSIDIDSEYDLPYMIGIVPKYTNHDWDTETTFLIVDNPLSNAVEGLTVDGGVIKRSIATSSDTHSRKALKGTENKYLFDVVSITQETGITIVCNGADASFKTVNLPQGRWDFTINGLRTITADTESFRSLMNDYGVQIVNVGNNEYLFSNNSNQEIKIEGLYPYAAGYDFNVVESSNESAKIHSVDNNGWVNRFTVCLVPASSLIWTITSGGVSSDYQYVNFTGEQSVFESTAKLSTTQALVEKYRGGLDPYTATVVNSLTGVSDWILDSANNRIKYFIQPTDPNNPTLQYLWSDGINKFTTAKEALESSCRGYRGSSYVGISNITINTDRADAICLSPDGLSNVGSSVQRVNNPNYNPNAEREEKYLPLETVAQQVISNAESGNVDAQKVVLSVALEKPLVSSLSDSNMQQWQAVKDAIGQLTGASSWTFDNVNKVIGYVETTTGIQPYDQYYFDSNSAAIRPTSFSRRTPEEACEFLADWTKTPENLDYTAYIYNRLRSDYYDNFYSTGACIGSAYNKYSGQNYGNYSWDMTRHINPNYDPNYTPPVVSITYQQVADRISANSNVADQGISLLAEAYIQEALLKFTDVDSIKSQFEANKQPK
jgi:hypothetical protein